MHSHFKRLLWGVVPVLLLTQTPAQADSLILNGVAETKPAALLNGRRETENGVDCRRFVEIKKGGRVGHNFTKAGNNWPSTLTCKSEVSIFSETTGAFIRKPMKRWTKEANDKVPFTLKGVRDVPTVVWIVSGPGSFATLKQQAEADVAQANNLLSVSKCGLRVDASAYYDRTSAVPIEPENFGCGKIETHLKPMVGWIPGIMNVYIVDQLASEKRTGVACKAESNNVIMLGSGRGSSAMAHEFGHWFALSHTCRSKQDRCGAGMPEVDNNNVMSVDRTGPATHFTAGQCYRANFDKESFVNKMGIRAGNEVRKCDHLQDADKECPGLKKEFD